MARNFDGNDTLTMGTPPVLTLNRDFSLSIWYKKDSDPASDGRALLSHGTSAWYLRTNSDGKLEFLESQVAVILTAGTAVGNGAYHHAVVTVDNASPANVIIYLDGVDDGSATTTGSFGDEVQQATIGVETSNSGEVEFFVGDLAECAIYGTALAPRDAAQLGAKFSPRLVRPDKLIAHWPLIGRTSPEIDIVNRNNATVTGATVAVHPPIIYPTQPISGFASAAVGNLNTEDKRRSGITPNTHVLMPLPDGTIVAVDRQQAAWIYSGIAAAAPAVGGQPFYIRDSYTMPDFLGNQQA